MKFIVIAGTGLSVSQDKGIEVGDLKHQKLEALAAPAPETVPTAGARAEEPVPAGRLTPDSAARSAMGQRPRFQRCDNKPMQAPRLAWLAG